MEMKNKLLMYYPASLWKALWRDAVPTGNGTIGAAVYGAAANETVMLSHEALWHHQTTQPLPDVSGRLPEVRRHLLNNEAARAQPILIDALHAEGYDPALGEPLPLADLRISQITDHGFRRYSRTLDMQTGEVSVAWNDGETRFCRDLFVSRTDDIVVCRISANGPGSIHASITLSLHDETDGPSQDGDAAGGFLKTAETTVDAASIFFAAGNDDTGDFGAVARVIINGHDRDAGPRGAGGPDIGELGAEPETGSVIVRGAASVLILVKVFVNGKREDEWRRASSELTAAGYSYRELFERHSAAHQRLFSSMKIDLRGEKHDLSNEELLLAAFQGEAPTALVEKMWAFGRHLLISSSREGGLPCPLQGLWTGDWKTFWAFNMVNENLQMIYWQALQGNLTETLLPVFDYHDAMIEDFRINARNLFGCRGIFVPAPTTPGSGLLKTLKPHIIHWTGGAAWIAQHYYDYYLFTGDQNFLRRRALPFMREAALFYRDFFTENEDGFFISSPSNSPENSPGRSEKGGAAGNSVATTMNATMDFALAKEVLGNLICGSHATGMYEDEIAVWEEMLRKIPPYQINEDGAIKEWMHPFYPDNYGHRHESHIYPVFPGTELIEEDDPVLFQAFVTAVKKRLNVGLKDQSAWSLTHMANAYARMGEGNLALEALELLSRSCVINNFFSFHNDWRRMGISLESFAPFQIDANMGWTSAVQEMLLFSRPGIIKFLPALPDKWAKGSFDGMLCRGQITASAKWDFQKGVFEATLLARASQTVTLKFPRVPSAAGIETLSGRNDRPPDLKQSPYGNQYRIVALESDDQVKIELEF